MPFGAPFNLPFFYGNYKNPNYSNKKNSSISNISKNAIPQEQKLEHIQQKASESIDASEAFFEIFGLKLYFDDILIICILFFLYTEKVKDPELFICLILLLLS